MMSFNSWILVLMIGFSTLLGSSLSFATGNSGNPPALDDDDDDFPNAWADWGQGPSSSNPNNNGTTPNSITADGSTPTNNQSSGYDGLSRAEGGVHFRLVRSGSTESQLKGPRKNRPNYNKRSL